MMLLMGFCWFKFLILYCFYVFVRLAGDCL